MAKKQQVNQWYNDYIASLSSPWELTKLSKKDEAVFKDWLTALPWYKDIQEKTGNPPDLYQELTGPASDYDTRKAWLNGITPIMYKYDNTYHWPSSTDSGEMLKSPTHPTAWMEYFMRDSNGIDPNQFGLSSPENARTWLNQYNSVLDTLGNL